MKRRYESPVALEEKFIANEYVAACYDYTAKLHCAIPGQSVNYCDDGTGNGIDYKGLWHGSPCDVSSSFKVIGTTGYGATETGNKQGNGITEIKIGASVSNIKGVYVNSNIGQNTKMENGYYKATWVSYENTTKYEHYGIAEVSGAQTKPGHPNHS